jgi:hypothetical protein
LCALTIQRRTRTRKALFAWPRSAASALAAAFLTGTSLAATQQDAPQQPGQVFVQADAVTGNAITVYDRTAGGTLRAAGAYSTGGLGGVPGGSVVDHLASQGSLAYDGTRGLLYAVNAGSSWRSITTRRAWSSWAVS